MVSVTSRWFPPNFWEKHFDLKTVPFMMMWMINNYTHFSHDSLFSREKLFMFRLMEKLNNSRTASPSLCIWHSLFHNFTSFSVFFAVVKNPSKITQDRKHLADHNYFFLYHLFGCFYDRDTYDFHFFSTFRTKWKRQTAVGLELLAEAGNYAAFQRLYGGPPYGALGGWPYPPQVPSGNPTSSVDLYYRQAAAAAALQKPLPYRLYPGAPGMPPLGLSPGPSASQFPHLTASNSLSTLSNFYSNSSSHNSRRSPSPTLDPGSPEGRSESNSPSDNEDTIQVWK